MTQKNISEKDDVGELFLTRLEREDLEKMGFDIAKTQNNIYADVFLMWKGDNFSIRFEWNGEHKHTYTQKVGKIPRWIFNYIIEKYIEA